MDVATIRWQHGYDRWATERVLECAANLTDEEFVRPDDIPHGSIRDTLMHAITVHWRWLSWCDGSLSGEEAYALTLDSDDFPDLASVRAKWEEVQQQNSAFLTRMTEEDLQRILSVEREGEISFSFSVGQVMFHIANHSMQHRTEVAMSLTRLGHSPGDLDYLFYVLEQDANVAR